MNRLPMALGVAAVMAGLGMSGQAGAVTIARDYLSHGTANCQAALPVFDGNIRKRPLAISNEGVSNAFVTCDTDTINNAGVARYTAVQLVFVNRSDAPVAVSYTLVDGISFGGTTTFFPKTTPAIAADAAALLGWSPTDNAGNNFRVPAISCNLLAGVEIGFVMFNYVEEIGA